MASVVKAILMKAGLTNQRIQVYIEDSTGGGLTGLVFNSAGLRAHYFRDGDASVSDITLVTATVGTYTSSGFKEVDSSKLPGVYEIGLPDAVIASGARSVTLQLGGATNMEESVLEILLTKMDVQNGRVDLLSTGLDQVTVESGINARQALSIIGSGVAGVVSGAETTTISFKAMDDDATTRISADVDSDNNRVTITLTPPA